MAREERGQEETVVALVGIIVKDPDSVERLNAVLHEFSAHIIGRMGIPHRERGIALISIALDAPADVVSALSGRIGNLPGVTSKTVYPKVD